MSQRVVFGVLVGLVFVQLFCILNLVKDMRKISSHMLEMLQVNHKASNVDTLSMKAVQTNEVK